MKDIVSKVNFSSQVNFVNKILTNNVIALGSIGEMSVEQPLATNLAVPNFSVGPFKCFFFGIGRIFAGFKNICKSKKQFISALILAFTWVVITVLPIFIGNSPFIKFLDFLTFANGGLANGIPGIIGGSIGKGVFAYFIFALVIPKNGTKIFQGVGNGLKNIKNIFSLKNLQIFSLMLIGIGLSLLTYNFLTGDSNLQNSMVGIAAFFVSIRALSNKSGFLRSFVGSILNRGLKMDFVNNDIINQIIAGWATGFAVALFLSFTGISIICYIVGTIIFAVGVILSIVFKGRGGS